MMYVFIISHSHETILSKSGLIETLAAVPGVEVLVKDNQPSGKTTNLATLCRRATLINDSPGLGFGANNNFLLRWIKTRYPVKREDFIALVNPDISMEASTLQALARVMVDDGCQFGTIALHKDNAWRERDPSVREFPSLSYWLRSKGRRLAGRPYTDAELRVATAVDWASGAFWLISAGLYEELGGFDERYFMYFEDVDFCFRAGLSGRRIRYFPQFRAVHMGMRANRRLFSQHFFWFVTGFLRFMVRKSFMKNR